MFILKKGHQPGVYVPLRALFLVNSFSSLHLQTFRSQAAIISEKYTVFTFSYR